ncbi:MAG: hypothetical protein WA976_07830, partial [Candidatus Dormiibacterota bacterium]
DLPTGGRGGAELDPAAAAQEALSKLVLGEDGDRSVEQLVGELLYSVVALARSRDVDAEGVLRRFSSRQRATLRRGELDDRAQAGARPPSGVK